MVLDRAAVVASDADRLLEAIDHAGLSHRWAAVD